MLRPTLRNISHQRSLFCYYLSMTTKKDWAEWHKNYNDSDSDLAKRLTSVQQEINNSLPDNLVNTYQVIDMCAGDGRDLIPVLAAYRHKRLVQALLVEIDQHLMNEARQAAEKANLSNIKFEVGDASIATQYEHAIPADLIMLCGVFGNISMEDVKNTINALPGFSKRGTRILWTRNRRQPDATPYIRRLFREAGFTEISFSAPAGTVYGVGLCEYNGPRIEFDSKSKLFSFIR